MDNLKEIRWRQRFQNFEKAFLNLQFAVEAIATLDKLSREGLIQRFEYTFELSWKTLKDYLEAKELIANFPKDVIKLAFQADLINNGEIWMQMLEKRNLLTHTYDEIIFNNAIDEITRLYFDEIKKLYILLKNEQ
jgi:nucleotidyltransferase substrate binding protein (TIGR01987 family)